MYHLKLVKGLSYFGVVAATRKNPDVYVKDKATADRALATGYFRLVDGKEETPEPVPEKKAYTKEELDAMTIIQLREAATKAGIKDTKALKRADLTNNILWAQGDYSTGSPTMIDLQKEI